MTEKKHEIKIRPLQQIEHLVEFRTVIGFQPRGGGGGAPPGPGGVIKKREKQNITPAFSINIT